MSRFYVGNRILNIPFLQETALIAISTVYASSSSQTHEWGIALDATRWFEPQILCSLPHARR